MANYFRFIILLLMIMGVSRYPVRVQATRILRLDQQGYSSFATLGIVCKCCDGPGGECRTTMDASCPKPKQQCYPWKFH
ncbi:hypothetical protein SLA2020_177290 [Shorea laevis]